MKAGVAGDGVVEEREKKNKVAGISFKEEYTYGQVNRDVRRFAKALRSLGLRKGHVVMVVLPNVIEYPVVALGIMVAGGIVSGANPASHVSEIKKQAESADAKSIVTDATTYEKVCRNQFCQLSITCIVVTDLSVT